MAVPVIASVQVTWTERPLLVNVATVVLAGLPTPNHALTAAEPTDCALVAGRRCCAALRRGDDDLDRRGRR